MINKVILIGNLTKDPESRQTPSGVVVTFSIACNEKWKDEDKVEFVNIVTFSKLAEICAKYLHKGKQVYIEGRLQTSSWEKDGKKHYRTEVIANTMKMLGSKGDDSETIPF